MIHCKSAGGREQRREKHHEQKPASFEEKFKIIFTATAVVAVATL